MIEASAFLSTILGIAASILALSVLVQVLQEMYKYLTNSKSLVYQQVLTDLLGPSVQRLWTAPEFAGLRVRGPFQLRRRRPGGALLPLPKDELVSALTRTAPLWTQRVMEQIQRERTASAAPTAPTSVWASLLAQLGECQRGTPGFWVAREIAQFLALIEHDWRPSENRVGHISASTEIDFARLELAFRDRFLPHVVRAERLFPLLDRHLEYANGRRNIRQTFVLGLLVTLVMGFSIQELFRQAYAMSPEDTVAIAERVVSIEEKHATLMRDSTIGEDQRIRALVDEVLMPTKAALQELQTRQLQPSKKPVSLAEYWDAFKRRLSWSYFIGCLVTAILISVGAPLWNDIVKSVLYFQQSRRRMIQGQAPPEKEGASA
ncbi:MAG: hypothetical protein AB1644_08525 [Candidatus Zixiibacteriota bacterium]